MISNKPEPKRDPALLPRIQYAAVTPESGTGRTTSRQAHRIAGKLTTHLLHGYPAPIVQRCGYRAGRNRHAQRCSWTNHYHLNIGAMALRLRVNHHQLAGFYIALILARAAGPVHRFPRRKTMVSGPSGLLECAPSTVVESRGIPRGKYAVPRHHHDGERSINLSLVIGRWHPRAYFRLGSARSVEQ